MDPSSLLPELLTSESDLLPTNTRIFPSSVRYGRAWTFSGIGGLLLFFVLLFLGVGVKHSAQKIVLILAFVELALLVGILVAVALMKRKQYARQIQIGEWHEGVIVFPSGDVVIRFNFVWNQVDTTIEAVYLSRAEVDSVFSFGSCRRTKCLRVYHLGIDAKPELVSITQDQLRDDLETVGAYIQDVKSRNLSSSF